jgi:hypothetical protein
LTGSPATMPCVAVRHHSSRLRKTNSKAESFARVRSARNTNHEHERRTSPAIFQLQSSILDPS